MKLSLASHFLTCVLLLHYLQSKFIQTSDKFSCCYNWSDIFYGSKFRQNWVSYMLLFVERTLKKLNLVRINKLNEGEKWFIAPQNIIE